MLVVKDERRWRETMTHFSEHKVLVPQEDQKRSQELGFRVGVDEIFAEHLKAMLAKIGFTGTSEPEQRLRLDNHGNRWTVDASGAATGKVETKDRFYRNDFALLAHEYDIRIDGAREFSRDKPGAGGAGAALSADEEKTLQSGWSQERTKRRVSFRNKEKPSAWRIDLTEVEVVRKNGASGAGSSLASSAAAAVDMELELELEPAALQTWLDGAEDDANHEKSKHLARELLTLLNAIIPHHLASPKEAELLEVATDEFKPQVARLTDVIKAGAAGGAEGASSLGGSTAASNSNANRHLEFVGSKPVNLLHKNLAAVRKRDYFVTEKSDGTRYLLYVVDDHDGKPLAVLLDQSKVIRKMRGGRELGRALGAGTVLDGELVFNRSFRETVFLIFDVLLIDGRSEVQNRFSVRSDKIHREIMRRCQGYLDAIAAQEASAGAGAGGDGGAGPEKPIKVIRKVFYTKQELSKLIERMSYEEGERVYSDPPRRHHKSDGLIFQPDTPYKFSSDLELLKWKWPELMTVDLQAVPLKKDGELIVSLKALGPDNVTVDCTKRVNSHVGLGKFDTFRLLADLSEDAGGANGSSHIAEVAYEPTVGAWRYLRPRRDKDRANHIDTVLGVFAEMAEAISVEELEYSILQPATSAQSDFAMQLGKMRKQLLDWQRDRSKRGK